jgi:protocatechuate 3,4-dioxygenase beta subunit
MTFASLRTWLLALCAVVLVSCGGGSSSDAGIPILGTGGSGSGNPILGGGGGSVTPTAASLILTLSANSIANDGSQTVTATAIAVNANNATVAGVPITFAVDTGVATPGGTVTGAAGTLTASIGIGSDQSNRTIKITATSGSVSKTAQLQVVSPWSSGGAPKVAVQLSTTTITSTTPATVTATVTDSSGNPVPNTVVALSTVGGTLAKLSVASALTNAQGVATAVLTSAATGVQGAAIVQANATVGSVQVQGSAGFTVTAQSPTISISPSSSTLTVTSAPQSLTVTVLDAAGNPVSNSIVTFGATNGLVKLDVASALTTAGVATVKVSPVSASTSGADIVTASTTVNGVALQALAAVQVNAQAPSVAATISSSAITATAPATLKVVARDLSGNLLPGAVVTFGSQSGLASFSPASQLTDANGNAGTVVSPKTSNTAGADVVTASVTVQGVSASSQTPVQFTSSAPTGTPTLGLALTDPSNQPTTSVSAAAPTTVTATLLDAQGRGAGGQVVTFNVVRGLATTNIGTALTNSSGQAVVVMSPASSTAAGADQISASVTYAGVALQQTSGFQVQATPVTLGALTAAANPLSAYGQTSLTLPVNGASVTAPVSLSFSSACVALGKATLSPATLTATTASVTVIYKDNGCGAEQAADQIQAVVTSTGTSSSLALNLTSPASSSIAFVQAVPEQIYLKGSGFAENSIVTFQVNDQSGNPLPNQVVALRLQTGAGGVTMEGRNVESVNPPSANPFTATTNAQGQVSVRVNSGTVPTPVRINAQLASNAAIATVSSNLSVAVGLPSQLNFSLSQGTKNIEGYNIDGTPNTYQIIAADRSGNPVPNGTSINFVTVGGQIEAVKQTQQVNGIARTTANFVSSEPRPIDGRITITAYALGEESFIDLNGSNVYQPGDPFQDLGNVFKDRYFTGVFDPSVDEYIPLTINNSSPCTAPGSNLLRLDLSIPSVPGTCDGGWSGAGQVYVRRAIQTVLSTSAARPLWAGTAGLDAGCTKITLQTGWDALPLPANPTKPVTAQFTQVAGDTWYAGSGGTALQLIVADANPGSAKQGLSPRLNPMAAGTTISASTPTTGVTVTVNGGSPVPSTTEVTTASIGVAFSPTAPPTAVVFVTFTSPSGTATTYPINVSQGIRPSKCP